MTSVPVDVEAVVRRFHDPFATESNPRGLGGRWRIWCLDPEERILTLGYGVVIEQTMHVGRDLLVAAYDPGAVLLDVREKITADLRSALGAVVGRQATP